MITDHAHLLDPTRASPDPMTGEHPHTPATILAAVLIQSNYGVRPSAVPMGQVPVWPVYVGHLPPTPDEAICIYDTTGYREGRIQYSGETVRKPGWQIRIRSRGYLMGAAVVKAIQRFLDTIRNFQVDVDSSDYMICTVAQTGDILSLGQEPEAARRENFTLNGTITYRELVT
jgi:hypothetical protein